jgi:hypothetical protein
VCIDHKTKEIKFRDPYPIWAKALVAAYLAEEGFLKEGLNSFRYGRGHSSFYGSSFGSSVIGVAFFGFRFAIIRLERPYLFCLFAPLPEALNGHAE